MSVQINLTIKKEVTYMQGFYCAKPLEKDLFEGLLKKDQGICTKLLSDN